jgi:hypothetical protein
MGKNKNTGKVNFLVGLEVYEKRQTRGSSGGSCSGGPRSANKRRTPRQLLGEENDETNTIGFQPTSFVADLYYFEREAENECAAIDRLKDRVVHRVVN